MRRRLPLRLPEILLFSFLALAILWRGGKGTDMTWLLGLLAVALTFLPPREGERETQTVSVAVLSLLWAFLGWSVLSMLATTTGNYGLDEIIRDASALLIFVWTVRRAGGGEKLEAFLRRFLQVLGIALLVACVVGVAVYVLQPVNRFVGSFFDYRYQTDYWPNAWAELVLFAWPLLLPWTRRGRWLLRTLLLGFVLGCLLLSYSRGGALVLLAQVLLTIVVVWRGCLPAETLRSFLRRVALAFVMAILTFALVNMVRGQFHPVESVGAKVTFTAAEGSSSFTERADFWRDALLLSRERPLLGWGPYSFRFIQPRLQHAVLATSDHPHNMFLKLAVERGWPAMLLFLAFLVFLLLPFIRTLWSRSVSAASVTDLRFWVLLGVTGVLLHNLIDYNLQFVGIFLPLWIALALLAKTQPAREKGRSWVLWAPRVLAALLFLLLLREGTYLATSSLGRRAQAAGRFDAAVQWYNRSAGEWYPRDLWLSKAESQLKMNAFVDAQKTINHALTLNQEDARAWKLAGQIAKKRFADAEALRDFEQAYLLGRYNDIGITTELLESAMRAGDVRWVRGEQGEVLTLGRVFEQAILANAHFVALSQNVEEFHSFADAASRLYPDLGAAFKTMDNQVQKSAQDTRAHTTARAPGYLW